MQPANSDSKLVKAALAAAWQKALVQIPQLALLGADGGNTRAKMAFVIEEAAALGVTDLERLATLALDILPKRQNR